MGEPRKHDITELVGFEQVGTALWPVPIDQQPTIVPPRQSTYLRVPGIPGGFMSLYLDTPTPMLVRVGEGGAVYMAPLGGGTHG